jgi:dynein heavy chain
MLPLQASKASASWRAYVDWFSEIVIDGFAAAIITSVRYLLAQIDPAQLARPDAVPLLEVQLELAAPDVVWKPELGEGPDGSGVRDMVKKWLMSFLEVS